MIARARLDETTGAEDGDGNGDGNGGGVGDGTERRSRTPLLMNHEELRAEVLVGGLGVIAVKANRSHEGEDERGRGWKCHG